MEKQLTEAVVCHKLRLALQKLYEEFPGNAENREALADGVLSVAVTCFLGSALSPTIEDSMKVIDITDKLKGILNEEKQKLDTHKSN